MSAPLADRLRPTELSEVCGQQHILGEGKLLRKIAEFIAKVTLDYENTEEEVRNGVAELCKKFPLYE